MGVSSGVRSPEIPRMIQAWYDAISGRRMDQHLIQVRGTPGRDCHVKIVAMDDLNGVSWYLVICLFYNWLVL